MTNFKFGDKVRVRSGHENEWKEGVYIASDMNDCEHPYIVYIDTTSFMFWKHCELVEATAEVLAPKFKVGDKVRVRDSEEDEWKEGLFIKTDGTEWPYLVLHSKTRVSYFRHCELVESVSETLTPKFKVGDKVVSEGGYIGVVEYVSVSYFVSRLGYYLEDKIQLVPTKIKVGDKVNHVEHTSLGGGVVLARFLDTNDNDCAVVQWRTLSCAIIEPVNKLELA